MARPDAEMTAPDRAAMRLGGDLLGGGQVGETGVRCPDERLQVGGS